MQVSLSELASPTFMTPLDALDGTTSSIHPSSTSFLDDFAPHPAPFSLVHPMDNSMSLELSPQNHVLSTSPPQSQIQSPTVHGTASSYAAGMTSSLESALDPTGVSTGRSRASTSVSPPANPPPFATNVKQSLPVIYPNTHSAQVESVNPLPATESQYILVPLLKQ
jgi:hypothetical protein